MKKFSIIAISIIVVLVLLYIFYPYKIETVCFGDVCPQNGGTYLLYKKNYTEKECTDMGAQPIVGIGWTRVYAGCSPDNTLARFIKNTFLHE